MAGVSVRGNRYQSDITLIARVNWPFVVGGAAFGESACKLTPTEATMKAVKLTLGVLLLLGVSLTLNSVWHVSQARSQVAAKELDVPKLRAVILPSMGEDPFATIPWETSLWTAREKAAKAGKPILLWEMDGHPLGCG
jgi:hypothetical protein